jgi:glycerate kinase
MHFLIAPNAFKNSLTAFAAAQAIARGLDQSMLTATYDLFPVGDGGDGTAALIIHHCLGKSVNCRVHDPLGRLIDSSFGWVEETQTAVIELADASGLRLLQPREYNPLHYTTFGTGELVRAALDYSPQKLILGIGGSATVDAGIGILQALGIRFLS